MRLHIKTNNKVPFPIISAIGQVDMSNCIEVHEAIIEQIDLGRPSVILDFKQLSFIDSACLGMLLRSLDRAKNSGGTIVIVGNPFIERVLTVTGLTHLFDLYASEEEALERLRSNFLQKSR